MADAPRNIRARQEERVLELEWHDGAVDRLPYRFLRGECPCAGCVNEFTGERMIDVDAIPETIQPTELGISGNYALKITWSDRHDTGLYTWDRLAALGRQLNAEREGEPGK